MPHPLMSLARTKLILNHPFFGVLALRMRLQESAQVPTLGVDGRTIFYNPEFVAQLTPELRVSALAHEVMHCVLGHISRRGSRHPRRWNIASDYALNPMLLEAGLPLGEDWLYDPNWAGLSADEIYTLLGDGDGSGSGDDPLCDVMQSPDDGPGEQETEWRIATVQAAQAHANSQGKLPASIRRLVDEATAPKVHWRDTLAAFMTDRAKDDYSFRRPNPYYIHSGIYLPIIDGVGMGEMVIALDTSGSVVSIIDEFGAAVRDIIASVNPLRTHVVYCDARINRIDTFERGQPLHLEAAGGGGTAFKPVFDHVSQAGWHPACLLYLTDMYGSFPAQAPEYPVLWCATSNQVAPFGQTLRIK